MFNSPKPNITILVVLFLLGPVTNCFGQSIEDQKKEFEAKMVKALELKLINRDSDYLYSSELRIFGDTIVGFWAHFKDNQLQRSYFIQSLSNPTYKIKFDNAKVIFPLISMIDDYRNGCLYFGRYVGTALQVLRSDGTLTDYFDLKQGTNLHRRNDLNKIMLYKNQVALSDNTGIYLYDLVTQKLIWEYTFKDFDGKLFRSILGNKLIMSLDSNGLMNVVCYDLDKHQLIWTKNITGNNSNISPFSKYGPAYPPPYPLFSYNNNVIVPGSNSCYLIDMDSGMVSDTVQWHSYSKDDKISYFKIENNKLYITNLNDDQIGLLCIDIKTNKMIWNVKEASLYGLYKDYVIGYNPDGTGSYLIIDKNTGAIKDKIVKPSRYEVGFFFVDNYIMINHRAVYK
jgi:hypothetical protein